MRTLVRNGLNLSWRKLLSYINQSTDLHSKTMDWFLYDADLRHEKVKIDSFVFNFYYFLLSLFLNLFSPYYRSFKPILRLLESRDAPASQYWATWALANLTKVYRKFFFLKKANKNFLSFVFFVFIFAVYLCVCVWEGVGGWMGVCVCVFSICDPLWKFQNDNTEVKRLRCCMCNAEALEPFRTLSYIYDGTFLWI